jgi:hypothetical protein
MSDPERSLVVAHHHPGRLRVRAHILEVDPELRRRAVAAVAGVDGVASVRETATGSVLVEYDPERVDAGQLLSEITAAATLWLAPPAPPRSAARAVLESGRALDARFADWTGGRVDLRVAVPAALAAGSIATLIFGARSVPRWDNLLYWSFTVFRALNDGRTPRDDPGPLR